MQAKSNDAGFFLWMSVAAALTVLAGFARTYYFRTSFGSPSLSFTIHLHAAVFTGWITLLGVQSLLITVNRPRFHRRLGWLGAALAVVVVLSGLVTIISGAKRGFVPAGTGSDPRGGIAILLAGLFAFSVLVAAGFAYRHRRQAHQRLMLLAAINLLPAAISRIWPAGIPLVFCAFVLAGPVYDRICGRGVHPAYLWGGILSLALFFLSVPFGATQAWQNFAEWLMQTV